MSITIKNSNKNYLLKNSFILLKGIFLKNDLINIFLSDLNVYHLFCNKNFSQSFKLFFFSYLTINHFYNLFFLTLFNKFSNINLKNGKKFLSLKLINKSLYLNKLYFKVENIIFLYNIIYLFLISLKLEQKKKGKKLIIIPRIAHFKKVFKISIKMIFYVIKTTKNNLFLNKLVSELYLIFNKEYLKSDLMSHYKNFLKTSIDNQSWLSLK
jgi:hypothetical protein